MEPPMEQPTQEKRSAYRIVSEIHGPRYVELSATYESDCIWYGAIQHLEVAFDDDRVVLCRLRSDEEPVKLVMTQDEMMLLSLASADYVLKEESVGQYSNLDVIDASIATFTRYLEALQAVSRRVHDYCETLPRNPFEDEDEAF